MMIDVKATIAVIQRKKFKHTCIYSMNKLPCLTVNGKFLITSFWKPFNITFTLRPSRSTNLPTSHTHTFHCSSGICPGLPGWADTRKVKTRKVKPIWIYWSKRQWAASAGPYASLHLIPDNHANILPLSFLQAGCHSRHPTNSVKALKAIYLHQSKHNSNAFRINAATWLT